jgi:transposase-like protein
MRPFETGKRALHHSWQINCASSDVGKEARSWYVDETYVNVKGNWCYLYRAIDRDGNLVDSRLSEKRDLEAAKRFFKQAVDVVGHAPERVTTDGHDS